MKLDPNGRKRVDAMKKALAAGLPLAGLLTAAACSEGPEEQGKAAQPQRNWTYRVVEADSSPMGDLLPEDEEEEEGPVIEMPEELEELVIAEDVSTLGVLLPPDALSPAECGGEANQRPTDDVVIRLEDVAPATAEQP